ncbi:hypothetical protein CVT25_007969 [Psilocybe cyanescens]|uniref:Zn(2)-C6 fungal-type domain-containing protein n=1 Tax=Psilocybe cyanescens TaxID=93625 RepID=A0A409XN08_PSICY|nr:hypothetical protein CVT25_007969 [Psilocybe cyanescens]
MSLCEEGEFGGLVKAAELEARLLALETRLLQIAPSTVERPFVQMPASNQTTAVGQASSFLSSNGVQKTDETTSMKQDAAGKPLSTKRRVGLSCDNCRRKKLICSKSKPACSQCTESGSQCTWFHATGQDAPPGGQYVQDLQARILHLEVVTSKLQFTSALYSNLSTYSRQQTDSSSTLPYTFYLAEIPVFGAGKGIPASKGHQSPIFKDSRQENLTRGHGQRRSYRTGSLPNPRKSDFSLPSQLTSFPPPPPLPSKNYDPAEKRRQREQKRQQREQMARLRHQQDGELPHQRQGRGYRGQEDDQNDPEGIEWRHYTIYGDLHRSLSSSRLTERDPVLSRPFSRPTSRPSSIGASPLTPTLSSQIKFPLSFSGPYDLPESTHHISRPLASLSHLAKPLPLPSDLRHRLQRVAREREWGRIGNQYSGHSAYIGSSGMSSPRSIPSRRYSRPPSPHPSRPSSRSSHSRQSPGPTFSRIPSQTTSRRSSFSYHSSARYSPGSSPSYSTSVSPQMYQSDSFSASPSSYMSGSVPFATTSGHVSSPSNMTSSPTFGWRAAVYGSLTGVDPVTSNNNDRTTMPSYIHVVDRVKALGAAPMAVQPVSYTI